LSRDNLSHKLLSDLLTRGITRFSEFDKRNVFTFQMISPH